jgi:soluble lytic murein transglycosylase
MDPQPQHTDPPSVQARVPQTGPLSSEEPQPQPQPTAPQPTASKPKPVRPNALMVVGIALLSIGLVALATWTYLSKQNAPAFSDPSGQSDLPRDTIALINSSTPIPLKLSPNVEDSAGSLTLPPMSDSWTPALREAHRAEIEGRYSSAISQYSALVGADAPGEAREALWGLASSYAASGQRDLALRAYSIFAGLNDPLAPAAFVRVGTLHEELSEYSDAAQIYGEYAKRGGPAANAVKLMQARLLGSTPEAEKLYNEVIDSNPLDPDLRQALSSLADVKAKRGDHAGARQLYERLASLQTRNPRPILDNLGRPHQALAADEAEAAGDKSGAVQSLLAYINRPTGYPYGRYAALATLLKLEPTAVASGTVAPMLAAQIAFDAGYYGDAITFMDIIRAAVPDSPERPAAALLTGRAFDLLGDATSAYNWYTATLQSYPTSPQAPGAIRRAADSLEEQSQWDASLGTFKQAVASYPNAGDETALARIHGAVLAYRLEDRDTALSLITPLLSAEISPTLKTQALFWAAKLQKSAGNSTWRDTIKPVSTLDPGSYFDFRARSLLSGEPDGGPIIPPFTITHPITLTVDYAAEAPERDELLAWASTVTSTHPVTFTNPTVAKPLSSPTLRAPGGTLSPGIVHSQPPFPIIPEAVRAVALLNLGFESEARVAFRALASQLQDAGDARGLAGLVIYLRYHATPYTFMPVAAFLSSMDPGDPTKQPTLLLKTLYPTPYSDLVLDQAQQRNIDPLLLYALLRQESQFVPDALSGADARGLAQVIPSTGQGIADQLGDTSYSVGDLYLPYVSVRYGTYYLVSNMPQFDRKLLPTLAAYNAGPGNAARWLQGSALLDPDLFSERVDLFETSDYLEVVYRNYGFYRLIYSP